VAANELAKHEQDFLKEREEGNLVLASAEAKVESLKVQLIKSEAEGASLRHSLMSSTASEVERTNAEQEAVAAARSAAAAKEVVSSQASVVRSLEESLKKCQQEVKERKQGHSILAMECGQLKAQLVQAQAQVESFQRSHRKAESERLGLQDQSVVERRQKDMALQDKAHAEVEVAGLRREVVELRAEKRVATDGLRDAQRQLVKQEEDHAVAKKTSLESWRESMAQKEKRWSAKEHDYGRQVEELQLKARAGEEAKQRLKEKLAEAKEGAQEERDEARRVVSEAQARAAKQIDALRINVETLMAQLEQVTSCNGLDLDGPVILMAQLAQV
jgi:chromosome segregation ATPase